MQDDVERTIEKILGETDTDPDTLRKRVLASPPAARAAIVDRLHDEPAGRRWLRLLLPFLDEAERQTIATRLLDFDEDFAASHRDSSMSHVVDALPIADMLRAAPRLAGSNAAGALWGRLAREAPERVPDVALEVLQNGDAYARTTTLSILVLDPYSEIKLMGPTRVDFLLLALNDEEAEVRGIAAEALADEATEYLATKLDPLLNDPSERVRMAAWDAAFVVDFADARDAATETALNESAPVDARRTALSALAAVLSTSDITPLLEVLVAHPSQALAEDAVNLLWTYHRNPIIATAAAESPHQSVRDVAQRLLHPETGSPAAGGSRPGAPDGSRDIYQEMLKGYEKREE
ncbi:MAG: hypothetical protein WBW04_10300 [Nitrolancea sp.]